MVEVALERRAGEVLRREIERWMGEIYTMVVTDLGAGERLAHLARIAASNVEEGEGPVERRGQHVMEDFPHRLMGQRVAIHQFLVGRPLLLELLKRGFVGDLKSTRL